LVDPVQDVSFDRDGTETSTGLFVDLDAWQFHLLAIRPSAWPEEPVRTTRCP
jgi:hypothetical protein